MTRRSILLGCLLAAGLAGCGPRLETVENYVLPVSEAGKLCVAQCKQANTVCQSAKELALQTCRAQGVTRAQAEYQGYLTSLPKDVDKKKIKTFSDFNREPSCYSNLTCYSDYKDCYKSCGGRIEAQTYCVSNCKEMVPPMPDGSPVGPKTTL
ncbi:hypothetical protein TSH58p_26240 (plasmid) [Azospirillum sp. TSH58]|nr:hypothetical protein TSH58p_26240 [Azospirillum sp. TSH58]PWC65249.1 hypothetical protein TSH58_21340 [Azospirillum sp. TSH58]